MTAIKCSDTSESVAWNIILFLNVSPNPNKWKKLPHKMLTRNWRERRTVTAWRKITGENNNETVSKVINSWWSSAGCRWLFWERAARCVVHFDFDVVVTPDLPPGFGVSLYWISNKYLPLLPWSWFISVGNSAGKPNGVRCAIIYETVFYNVICDFTTCTGGSIYE